MVGVKGNPKLNTPPPFWGPVLFRPYDMPHLRSWNTDHLGMSFFLGGRPQTGGFSVGFPLKPTKKGIPSKKTPAAHLTFFLVLPDSFERLLNGSGWRLLPRPLVQAGPFPCGERHRKGKGGGACNRRLQAWRWRSGDFVRKRMYSSPFFPTKSGGSDPTLPPPPRRRRKGRQDALGACRFIWMERRQATYMPEPVGAPFHIPGTPFDWFPPSKQRDKKTTCLVFCPQSMKPPWTALFSRRLSAWKVSSGGIGVLGVTPITRGVCVFLLGNPLVS